MSPDPARENEQLLDFFYRCPVGLISFADDGRVRHINPAAVSLLTATLRTIELGDVYAATAEAWPELADLVVGTDERRVVVDDHHLTGTEPRPWALGCSLVRVDDDHNMLVVADATDRVAAEQAIRELLASERAARIRLELLEGTALQLATAVDVATVASTVLAALESSLGLTLTTVEVPEGDGVRAFAGSGFPSNVLRAVGTIARDADLIGATAIRDNEMIHLPSRAAIEERFPRMSAGAAQLGVRSVLALPLRSADKESIGALVVGTPDEGWFDTAAQSLLAGVAGQTGLALERAQLYERVDAARAAEHTIAVRLQAALLPDRVVEHPAISIGVRVTAASAALAVGGDWFDTFAWSDGAVGVIVGDVVGHDLEAAAAIARLGEPAPARLLEHVDDFARAESGADFSTAICVVLDVATGVVRFASAGHPPALVVPPSGEATFLDAATSPPLGALPAAHRPESALRIDPGSVIVLFTDGLVERRDRSLDDGLDELTRIAQQLDRDDPQRFTEQLHAAMTADAPMQDDVAVVALGWHPVG